LLAVFLKITDITAASKGSHATSLGYISPRGDMSAPGKFDERRAVYS